MAPHQHEIVIQKNFPNSFRGTRLLDYLRERDIGQLVIGGMMTHMCVDSTIRAAADLDFDCFLAHDACATKDLSFGGVTIPADYVQTAFLAALNGLLAELCNPSLSFLQPGPKMKAMVLNQIGDLNENRSPLVLMDWPDPSPGPGELLIKVSACGVCHTELDEIEGRTPPPRLPDYFRPSGGGTGGRIRGRGHSVCTP